MGDRGGHLGIPKPKRFIWPPRGPDAGAPEAAEPADAAIDVVDRPVVVEVAPATSPASAPIAPARAASSPAPPAAREGRLSRWIQEVEVVWLGQITPPLQRRMAEQGWQPDEPTAYCARCGRTAGPHDADPSGCSGCRGTAFPWERLVRLGEFEGLLRDAVHEVKYTRWRRLGTDLGRLLGRALAAEMERSGLEADRTVLVPVPTSFWRRVHRGIDHPLVIARGIAQETGLRVEEALHRRHRPTQQSLPASRRAANVSGAIMPHRWATLGGRNVVLVDDVTTTRATLRSAARAVRAGARASAAAGNAVEGRGGGGAGVIRVWAAVLAVTPEPDRR